MLIIDTCIIVKQKLLNTDSKQINNTKQQTQTEHKQKLMNTGSKQINITTTTKHKLHEHNHNKYYNTIITNTKILTYTKLTQLGTGTHRGPEPDITSTVKYDTEKLMYAIYSGNWLTQSC